VDEYLIYTQVYVYLFPEVLKSAREKFEQFSFPRGNKVGLTPDKVKSFEIIYLLPEFQEWITDYKKRAMRVNINGELVNQFTDFISKSKSKIAIAAMSKLNTSSYSSRSQGAYGAAYEYLISRREFILQLPEFEAWKIKFHIVE
jgi:hypothetical protein